MLGNDDGKYNVSTAFTIRQDKASILRSIQLLVSGSPGLRTTFRFDGSGPVTASIQDEYSLDSYLIEEEFDKEEPSGDEISPLLERNASRTLIDSGRPLFRIYLLSREPNGYVVQIVVHHAIADGWTLDLLATRMIALCKGDGAESSIGKGELDCYADFIRNQTEYLSSSDESHDIRFWERYLKGAQPPMRYQSQLADCDYKNTDGSRVYGSICPDVSRKIQLLAKRERVSMFAIFAAVFNIVMNVATEKTDIVIGFAQANRLRQEFETVTNMFANITPLRTLLDRGETFIELLKRLHENYLEVIEHSSLPIDRIAKAAPWMRSGERTPVFQASIEYHRDLPNYIVGDIQRPEVIKHSTGKSQYELALYIHHRVDETVDVALEYRKTIFSQKAAEELLVKYLRIVESILSETSPRIGEITDQLRTIEGHQSSLGRAETIAWSGPIHLAEMFEATAIKFPKMEAIVSEREVFTYGEVYQMAVEVTASLQARGVNHGQKVVIHASRDAYYPIVALAVLACGAVYVPLDPFAPQKRKDLIISDVNPSLIISGLPLEKDDASHKVISISKLMEERLQYKAHRSLPNGNQPDDTAYIIYTSGSTGNPKGACISHRAIANTLLGQQQRCPSGPGDRHLLNSNLAFDGSILSLFAWFLGGSALYVPEEGVEKNSDKLARVIVQNDISHVFCTTSLGKIVAKAIGEEHKHNKLKIFQCGGEALTNQEGIKLQKLLSPAVFENVYGPTETAALTTYMRYTGSEPDHLTYIGRPFPNTEIYILRTDGDTVSPGEEGEILIGGDGVGQGYLNLPSLTRERFIKNTFIAKGLLYRSGDLGRFNPDGLIEYLGRIDDQVKIRGYRIELGEVESAVRSCNIVDDSVVKYEPVGQDRKLLIAYIVPKRGISLTNPEVADHVKKYLKTIVPDYMIPHHYILHSKFSLTANGKVDRAALRPVGKVVKRLETAAAVGPETRVAGGEWNTPENKLIEIWKSLLLVDRIEKNSSFFERGGDSITAIQAVSAAKEAGIDITVTDIFDLETPEKIARKIDSTKLDNRPFLSCDQDQPPLPLPMHRRMARWAFTKPEEFYQSILIPVGRKLSKETFDSICEDLLSSHEELSYTFKYTNNRWWPHLPELKQGINAGTYQLTDTSPISFDRSSPVFDLLERIQSEIGLRAGPAFRMAHLLSDSGYNSHIYCCAHHAIIDGISWGIIERDVRAVINGKKLKSTSDRRVQKVGWGAWSRALATYSLFYPIAEEKKYWIEVLSEHVDGPKIDESHQADINPGTIVVEKKFSAIETDSVIELANAFCESKMNVALLGIVGEAICRTWDIGSFRLFIEGHGRNVADIRELLNDRYDSISETLGWFTIVFPFNYVRRTVANSPKEVARNCEVLLKEISNIPRSGIGYSIMTDLYDDGELTELERATNIPIAFNYLGKIAGSRFEGLCSSHLPDLLGKENKQPFPLSVNCIIEQDSLRLGITADPRLASEVQVSKLLSEISRLILAINSAEKPISKSGKKEPDKVSFNILGTLDSNLVQHCIASGGSVPEIVLPASSLQRGLLFHSAFEGRESIYTSQLRVAYRGKLNPDRFYEALNATVKEYLSLRSCFHGFNLETPFQAAYPDVKPSVRMISTCSDNEFLSRFERLCEREKSRKFIHTRAPLWRVLVVNVDEEISYIVLTWHHAILDGWSLALVWARLRDLYDGNVESDVTINESELMTRYFRWSDALDYQAGLEFWQRELKGYVGARASDLAYLDHNETSPRAKQVQLVKEIGIEQERKIKAFCSINRITMSTYFQLCFALVLRKFFDRDDIVYGTTVSGRRAGFIGVNELVGCFIRTVPARFLLDEARVTRDLLTEIHARGSKRDYYSFVDLPDILAATCVDTDQRGNQGELFRSMLVFENYPADSLSSTSGSNWSQFQIVDQTHYDITAIIVPHNRLSVTIEYRSPNISAEMGDTLMSDMMAVASRLHVSEHIRDVFREGL